MESSYFSVSLQTIANQSHKSGKSKKDRTDFFTHLPVEVQVLIGENLRLKNIVSLMQTSRTLLEVGKRCTIEKARFFGFRGRASFETARSYLRLFFRHLFSKRTVFSEVRGLLEQAFERKARVHHESYLPQSSIEGKVALLHKVDLNTRSFVNLTPPNTPKLHIRDFVFHYLQIELPEQALHQFSLALPAGRAGLDPPPFTIIGLFVAALSNEKELFTQIWNNYWFIPANLSYPFEVLPLIMDSEGNNLMHMAAYMGHTEVLKAIRRIDRTSAEKCMRGLNNFNETPYDMALSQGNQKAVTYLRRNFLDPSFRPFSLVKFSCKRNLLHFFREGLRFYIRELHLAKDEDQLLGFLAGHAARVQDALDLALSPQLGNGISRADTFRGIRSLIRAGLKFEEACKTGYDFVSTLALDSTHVFFKYFESADLASLLLNKKRFSELKRMLSDESSRNAVIDTVTGFSLQEHKNALEFAENGIIESDTGSIILLSYLIKDFEFLLSDLKVGEERRSRLIERWLPASQLLQTSLIEQALDAGLTKVAAFFLSSDKLIHHKQ